MITIDFVPKEILQDAQIELENLGEKVIDRQVFEWIEDAENNLPYIVSQDLFGHQQNRLVTSQGWKNLKALGIREGYVVIFFQNLVICIINFCTESSQLFTKESMGAQAE